MISETAEYVFNQIANTIEELAKKKGFELYKWYHDEPRWVLRRQGKRGSLLFDISYRKVTDNGHEVMGLVLSGLIFENNKWNTIYVKHNDEDVQVRFAYTYKPKMGLLRFKVPKRNFKDNLSKMLDAIKDL